MPNWFTYKDRVDRSKIAYAKQLRKNPTHSESIVWFELREKKLGVRFHRQRVMFGYIVDFWCPREKIVLEIDGPIHDSQKELDNKRDEIFLKHGIKVLRFKNEDVLNNLSEVINKIENNFKFVNNYNI
jgi:very-short-patch-repair endonuclease